MVELTLHFRLGQTRQQTCVQASVGQVTVKRGIIYSGCKIENRDVITRLSNAMSLILKVDLRDNIKHVEGLIMTGQVEVIEEGQKIIETDCLIILPNVCYLLNTAGGSLAWAIDYLVVNLSDFAVTWKDTR